MAGIPVAIAKAIKTTHELIFDVIPYTAELALSPPASYACPEAGPSNGPS
jgi:hypothetical protein